MRSTMEKMDKKELGDRLKARRTYLKMTQQDVADALSIERTTYAQQELGRNEIAATELPRYAKVLGVRTSYFFPDDEFDDNDDGPAIMGYYNGLPPEVQDDFEAQIKAVYERHQRAKTTHGKKAE